MSFCWVFDDAVLSDFKRLARSPALAAADTPAKMSGRMISRPDIVQATDLLVLWM